MPATSLTSYGGNERVIGTVSGLQAGNITCSFHPSGTCSFQQGCTSAGASPWKQEAGRYVIVLPALTLEGPKRMRVSAESY